MADADYSYMPPRGRLPSLPISSDFETIAALFAAHRKLDRLAGSRQSAYTYLP